MLKHIVFFKLKDEYSMDMKLEITTSIQNKLQSLASNIPEIKSLETGLNINNRKTAFDVSLTVILENEKALSTYRQHPKHIVVLEFLNELNLETAVIDYII